MGITTEMTQQLLQTYMRKDGTLRFGDFVAAVLHLLIVFR
jgi:hypothetical protein